MDIVTFGYHKDSGVGLWLGLAIDIESISFRLYHGDVSSAHGILATSASNILAVMMVPCRP